MNAKKILLSLDTTATLTTAGLITITTNTSCGKNSEPDESKVMVANFDENCVLKYSNNRKEGTLNADIWYKIKGENNWIGLFDGSYSFKAGQTVYFKGDNPKGLTQINELINQY